MWQRQRAQEKEILDLGQEFYTKEEYDRCLKQLTRINVWLGGFKAITKALKRVKTPLSILEVGCGSGSLCQHLYTQFACTAIVGIDINDQAILHATSSLPKAFTERVTFYHQRNHALEYPDNSFDAVIAMLVTHHMDEQELILFLKESYRVAKEAVILNDLHRHFLAYIGFSFLAPFLFKSRLIWNDGRISIRRGFRKEEWISLLKQAGFQQSQYSLKRNWAFRWTLTLRKI